MVFSSDFTLSARVKPRRRRYAHHFNGWLNKFTFLCNSIDMLIDDYYVACAFHVHIIRSISDWNAVIMAIQRCKLYAITCCFSEQCTPSKKQIEKEWTLDRIVHIRMKIACIENKHEIVRYVTLTDIDMFK